MEVDRTTTDYKLFMWAMNYNRKRRKRGMKRWI